MSVGEPAPHPDEPRRVAAGLGDVRVQERLVAEPAGDVRLRAHPGIPQRRRVGPSVLADGRAGGPGPLVPRPARAALYAAARAWPAPQRPWPGPGLAAIG